MIIKLIGAAMVLASCLATARTITSFEKTKCEQIDSFIALIKYIRNRIDCYSIPMDKIFAECPAELLETLGGRTDSPCFEELLRRKSILVDGEGRHILEEFSESLGKNYRDRQIKLCDSAISSLEAVRAAESKNYTSKRKTVNALCIVAGGMVIILLL